MDFDESELDENGFDENGFWWKWILMKVVFWWKWFWWKWFLMKSDNFIQFWHLTVHVLMGPKIWKTTNRLASLAARSHFPASSIRSFSICPKLLLEWDEIQKLLAHTMLHIWCAFSFDVQQDAHVFLSTFPLHWLRAALATIWHNRGASPVPHCMFEHGSSLFLSFPRYRHFSPSFCTSPLHGTSLFCQYSHLSTKTYLHYESYLPSNIWSFLDSSWRSLCFGCDLRQWRRGACRSDYNTTSARLSMAWKNAAHSCLEQFQHVETSSASSSCKGSTCLLSLQTYSHETQWPTRWGKGPHHKRAKMFFEAKS